MTFGENLRSIRKNKKISLQKLGEIIETSHTHIANIEKGIVGGSDSIINKILNALELSEEEKENLLNLRKWENSFESIKEDYPYLKFQKKEVRGAELIHIDELEEETILRVPIYKKIEIIDNKIKFIDRLGYTSMLGTQGTLIMTKKNEYLENQPHNMIALKLEDDSMESKLQKYSTVIISFGNWVHNKDIGLFYINGEYVIRQILSYGEISLLRAFNSRYEDIIISEYNDFKVLGRLEKSELNFPNYKEMH